MSFVSLVPDFVKLPVAAIIGGLLIFYPAKWYGASQEKTRNELAQLAKTIEVLRDRQTTDDQVANADAASMCASLGLSGKNLTECVRRVAEADAELANICNDTENGSLFCEPSGVTQRVRGETGLLVPRLAPTAPTAAR
jgi:hypothetical protein